MTATTLENWSGAVRFAPRQIAAPSSTDEFARLIASAREAGSTVRPRGSMHSFTPLSETNDVLVSLENFKGIDSVDTEKKTAWIKAGTNLFDMNPALHEMGLSMPNLGDIDRQTLAGAISTGTHGTGATLGALASFVTAIEFVAGTGELVRLTQDDDGDTFRAAVVNIGALGIVTRYRLALRDSYKLRAFKAPMRFGEALERMAEFNAQYRHFEFYWFPHTDRTQVKMQQETNDAPTERGVWKFVDNVIVENGLFGAILGVGALAPKTTPSMARLMGSAVSASEEVGWSHKIFCTARYVRFQEMEYGVPAENAAACLRAIEAYVRAEKPAVSFPIEVRFVRADNLSLAPSFGRDNCFIAVHQFKGMAHTEYFRRMETILRDHGGRPHWGKMHTLEAKDLAPLYPEWNFFQAVRNQYDPRRVMSSPYLTRVLGK